MSILKNFISSLTLPSATTAGKVVASTEVSLSVATRSGVIVVPRERTSLYAVGDEVRVANGVISGKVRSTSSLPVYEV